ncbi:MAG: hypothetical protein EBR82_62385 [Caulobacteraceae bacterium]|jgi:hypothetical protein|nr:hypothetical protein [Caulobacteraceae bacterium]
MAHFDLSLYETVAQRLVRWWAEFPDGRIITSIHHYDGSTIIMRAECYNNDDRLIATGYAEEVFGNSPVNKTSFLENCETSAIGRAISNSRIGHTGERASVSEMEKVNRVNSTPRPDSHGSATPKQIGFLKSLARGKGWDDVQLLEYIHRLLQVDDVVVETLTAGQCSAVIDGLKK